MHASDSPVGRCQYLISLEGQKAIPSGVSIQEMTSSPYIATTGVARPGRRACPWITAGDWTPGGIEYYSQGPSPEDATNFQTTLLQRRLWGCLAPFFFIQILHAAHLMAQIDSVWPLSPNCQCLDIRPQVAFYIPSCDPKYQGFPF